jgi:hypothetical protein
MPMNYGYIDFEVINKQAKVVCNCLGYGINHTAHKLIVETATTETGLGRIKDTTLGAGMGICQFDKMPFYDIRDRSAKYKEKIYRELGVDIDLVEWEHLRYNSFLSLLFCRLHYKPFPEAIPQDIKNRAAYWKKYYNTELGKGDVEHYLRMNNA